MFSGRRVVTGVSARLGTGEDPVVPSGVTFCSPKLLTPSGSNPTPPYRLEIFTRPWGGTSVDSFDVSEGIGCRVRRRLRNHSPPRNTDTRVGSRHGRFPSPTPDGRPVPDWQSDPLLASSTAGLSHQNFRDDVPRTSHFSTNISSRSMRRWAPYRSLSTLSLSPAHDAVWSDFPEGDRFRPRCTCSFIYYYHRQILGNFLYPSVLRYDCIYLFNF